MVSQSGYPYVHHRPEGILNATDNPCLRRCPESFELTGTPTSLTLQASSAIDFLASHARLVLYCLNERETSMQTALVNDAAMRGSKDLEPLMFMHLAIIGRCRGFDIVIHRIRLGLRVRNSGKVPQP